MSAIVTSIVGSSIINGISSNNAANTAANANQQATAVQQGMFNTVQSNMQPYMQAGQTALGQLNQYMNASETGGPNGQPGLLHQFGAADLNANMAPNYQFQLGQGMGQLGNQNAASGGAGGGNAFAGEQAYAQNMAGSAYQNAYNNYNNNQQNIYSRLGTLAQLGQASGTNTALGASAFGQNIGNTIVGAGNAQAAGQMGVANSLSNGINNGMGYYLMNNMLNNQPLVPGTNAYNAYNNSLMGDPTSSVQNPPT